MSAFDAIIGRVLTHEGGYVWDFRDPGGETNYGISRRAYPDEDIRAMTRARAVEIYRRDYWNPVHGDDLPHALAFQALDAAVNHGPEQARKWIQQAAGVAVDGDIGPRTLAAVHDTNPVALALRFNAARLQFYSELPGWAYYGKGWTRRVAANLIFAATDLA